MKTEEIDLLILQLEKLKKQNILKELLQKMNGEL